MLYQKIVNRYIDDVQSIRQCASRVPFKAIKRVKLVMIYVILSK